MTDTTTTGPWVPVAGAEGPWRTARTRGALSGLALVLLGLWGGLVPFVGPYLGFGFTPATPWAYTPARLWLLILPAAVTLICGLVLVSTANRATATLAGGLAAAAGTWFVVGPGLYGLVTGSPAPAGVPLGGALLATVEEIGLFTGLGVVIVGFAAVAAGRFSVRGPAGGTRARRPV
jgi:hypothetical protein